MAKELLREITSKTVNQNKNENENESDFLKLQCSDNLRMQLISAPLIGKITYHGVGL